MTDSVRVKATDYNGTSFDGFPFSDNPDWLMQAVEAGHIQIYPDDRDYALWKVNGAIAEPGDEIVRAADGSLRVEKRVW